MEWKPVCGFEGLYEVSDEGFVRSVDRRIPDGAESRKPGRVRFYPGGEIKGHANSRGYIYVTMARRNVGLHRAVLLAFGPPQPTSEHVVHHIDGVKSNNNIRNLVWVTHTENNRHARKFRLNRAHGENCNFTVFSDKRIDAIRILWPTNRFTLGELSELFGISIGHISQICRGLTRKAKTDHGN